MRFVVGHDTVLNSVNMAQEKVGTQCFHTIELVRNVSNKRLSFRHVLTFRAFLKFLSTIVLIGNDD